MFPVQSAKPTEIQSKIVQMTPIIMPSAFPKIGIDKHRGNGILKDKKFQKPEVLRHENNRNHQKNR